MRIEGPPPRNTASLGPSVPVLPTGGIFKSAAVEVLRREKRLMPTGEICRLALEWGLLTCQGKTPEATMASSLYGDIKRRDKTSFFVRPREGLFGLREWVEQGILDLPPEQPLKLKRAGSLRKAPSQKQHKTKWSRRRRQSSSSSSSADSQDEVLSSTESDSFVISTRISRRSSVATTASAEIDRDSGIRQEDGVTTTSSTEDITSSVSPPTEPVLPANEVSAKSPDLPLLYGVGPIQSPAGTDSLLEALFSPWCDFPPVPPNLSPSPERNTATPVTLQGLEEPEETPANIGFPAASVEIDANQFAQATGQIPDAAAVTLARYFSDTEFLGACETGELVQLVSMENKVDLVSARFGVSHPQTSRANMLLYQAYRRRQGSLYFTDRALIALRR